MTNPFYAATDSIVPFTRANASILQGEFINIEQAFDEVNAEFGINRLAATSVSTVTIGTGSKTFLASTRRNFSPGQFVIAASTASVANYMLGQVTAYDGETGSLTINVLTVSGVGSYSSWAISQTSSASANAVIPGQLLVGIGSSSYKADINGTLHVSGAVTLGDDLAVSGSMASDNLLMQGDGADGYVRPTNAGSNLYLGANNANHIQILSGGNVGIGGAPTVKFDLFAGSAKIRNYGGTNSSPTEALDWPNPVLNLTGYGDFNLQTMLAFTLPNDGDIFYGSQVWNFKLEQTANSITSAGVKGLQLGGPGYLAFLPQGGPLTVNGISSDLGGTIVGSGMFRVAASGGYAMGTWHSGDYTAVQFVRAGTQVGTIVVTSGGTAYNTTSDERLKDDDGLLEPAVAAAIMRLIAIHRFRWKETGEDDIGAFAQELHRIYPRAVTPGGWFDKETGAPVVPEYFNARWSPWCVDYSKLVPIMAAAWQHLDIEHQSLADRVAQLEG